MTLFWIGGGISAVILLVLLVFSLLPEKGGADFERVKSQATVMSKINLVKIGMTPSQLQAVLGQPNSIRPTEYVSGVNGPAGFWYEYVYRDAKYHSIMITIDLSGTVIEASENIELVAYPNEGSDAAFFLQPDPDGVSGYIVRGKPYDLEGNKIDLNDLADTLMRQMAKARE